SYHFGVYFIYDNSTSRDNPLWKKCGNSIPEPIRSKENQLFVEFYFYPASNWTNPVFLASWAEVCGGALSGDNGTITSPNYPNNYWNEARCVWSITVEPGKFIWLTFHEFAVEDLENCAFDWVLVS
ncbi:hypothetical protein EGW08_023607, partial [Elysia chlorotica]